MINGIKPICRYGHGELIKISPKDRNEKYGYLNAINPSLIFSGALFSCQTCGYTELFDDDIKRTKMDLEL